MKALTFAGERAVRIEDVPKPVISAPTDVLVKVTVGAICGSDLHLYHLRTPIQEGAVLGHEFVGVVEDVGSAVHRFQPGDRVVAAFFTHCGHCHLCRRGWFSQCESRSVFGHGAYFGDLGGGQAEYCVVPLGDHTLELIPDGVRDDQALFVGDILSTGYFGAERAGIRTGDAVAVVGAGPVGLMAVMAAQLFGPARVFAIDMVPERLELAATLGAIPVNAGETHAAERILSLTGGFGADAAIECVGASATIETAIGCVRGGGTVSVVGVPNTTSGDFPYLNYWVKNLTYTGGFCNVNAYMRPLLDLIAAGRLDPSVIVSHRMSLDEGPKAYEMFANRQATKILLTP